MKIPVRVLGQGVQQLLVYAVGHMEAVQGAFQNAYVQIVAQTHRGVGQEPGGQAVPGQEDHHLGVQVGGRDIHAVLRSGAGLVIAGACRGVDDRL